MPRVKSARPPASRAAAARAAPRMQDRPGRWKLLWRRQRQLLRPAIAGAALVAFLFAVAGIVHLVGTGQNFGERAGDTTAQMGLRIHNVVVNGRQKTPEGLVRAALGVSAGDPILAFSVAGARARLESINWVKSATVERRLPGTIVVTLVERAPFAVWQHEGKFSLVDRDGNMVTDSDVSSFAGQVPLIVGPGAPKAAAALLDMLAQQPDLMGRLVAAVRVGERRWNLRMNNGADVMLPEGAESQALARLAELQSSNALLDRPLQAVDLRLPDRLVVRPLPDPAHTPDSAHAASGKKPT